MAEEKAYCKVCSTQTFRKNEGKTDSPLVTVTTDREVIRHKDTNKGICGNCLSTL